MDLQKIRSYRIFKVAAFDLITAFIGMILCSLLLRYFFFPTISKQYTILVAILLTIPIGIITHYMLDIKTTLNTKIGL
jgi:hypothetical protein